MEQQNNVNFYGGIAKRVIVISPKEVQTPLNYSNYDFIKTRFNSVRNYKEFKGSYPVQIIDTSICPLPDVDSLSVGDVCLIIGQGRVIDKECYDFALKCFSAKIPVYFIRLSSRDYDSRVSNEMVWKSNIIVENVNDTKKIYQATGRYFMEIPSKKDLILVKTSDNLYALLPGMVPVM